MEPSKETSIKIWKFLDKNFRISKGMIGVRLCVKNRQELETNLCLGGLPFAIIKKFPEVKANVLINIFTLSRAWVKQQLKK